jgi:hypothetical protein
MAEELCHAEIDSIETDLYQAEDYLRKALTWDAFLGKVIQ